jgi:drug/metabolite transporter (DMT)-like permease
MHLRDAAAPISVALIWGVNVPLMKAGLAHLDPYAFNALRLTLSAIALGLVDRIEHRGREVPPTPWRTVLWFGLLSSFVYQVLFLLGMDATSAGNTAILIASGPLWTALIGSLLRVERHAPRAWLALGIAFVGTLLVTTGATDGGEDASRATLVGNLAVLASMIAWALATVLSRPILDVFPATRLAFLATVVSLPGHWALAAPRLARVPDEHLGLVAGAIVYSGVLSTGVAYALWNRSVKALGPARTSAFSNLVPVVALAVAWVALGEVPGAVQVAGGALVIAGLVAWRSGR